MRSRTSFDAPLPTKPEMVFNPILIVSVNDCVILNGSHFKLRSTFVCTNGIIAVSRIELESDDNESSELPLLPHRANRKEWGTTIFAPHQYEKIYLMVSILETIIVHDNTLTCL